MPALFRTLKFQIILAIALLTALFASSTIYSLHIIDQQHSDDVLVQLAGRLQFNQQHLTVQAMRYRENAPRDYPSYYRDLGLYFEDLKKTRAEMSRIISAFAANRFDQSLVGESTGMRPNLAPRSRAAAVELADAWQAFTAKLDERIGPDPAEPRLEWAAEWIGEQNRGLEEASHRFATTLAEDVAARARSANRINRWLLATALLVSLGIGVWFYRRVLGPLAAAVEGFGQVANGDFSYRVSIDQNNEIGWLADSFNRLAKRMESLRTLLTRLEQGEDLDGTLRTLSETLPALIPVDWIGLLVLSNDGLIHLEKAYTDGRPETIGRLSFEPDRTLLEECIHNGAPLHVADVPTMSGMSERYVFLRRLAELGRRDAVFMPLKNEAGIAGVAVFASRYPNSYRTEHLTLLRNLGALVTVSLGRTIQLAESTRLANIGQFASGIAHEIRNPLATISLALDHLAQQEELSETSGKRIQLAREEMARLERLLADILLYAKPISLDRQPHDLVELVAETAIAETDAGQDIEISSSPCPLVPADRDRIRQVLLNLIRNAQQASPSGRSVHVHCRPSGAGWVEVEIANEGEPIPAKALERVFEPFVTSKINGTGLGLPIVRRIVDAHGGQVELLSDNENGTRAILRLPTAAADVAGAGDQAADAVD